MISKWLKVLLSTFLISGTSLQANASERAQTGWQLIEDGALLVDVRTPQEYADGHLAGSVNYPLQALEQHFAQVGKDQLIVLYCRSGNRSGIAYNALKEAGFTRLHNAGGYQEMLASKP